MKRRAAGGAGLALAVSAALVVGPAGRAVSASDPTGTGGAPGDGTVTVRVVDDANANGVYDSPSERGRPDVRVTLTDDAGDELEGTTDASGVVRFRPATSSLTGGQYRVQVDNPDPGDLQPAIASPGDGPHVIRGNVGFVDVSRYRNVTYTTGFWDPDAHCEKKPGRTNGLTGPEPGPAPGPEPVCEAPAQIGDRVWFDTNGNGIQDPSESPVRGVKVTLHPTPGGPDLTTYTDAEGEYYLGSRQGLRPKTTYRVTFDHRGADVRARPAARTSLAPAQLKWTVREAGPDRAIDSDVDAYGRTTVRVGDPGHVNHTVDAGLVKSLGLTLVKLDEKTYRPLPGAVFELWRETNGIPGLQRYGMRQDRFVNDCATSSTGRCSFGSLPVGTYYLVETDVPEGYLLPKRPVTGPYVLTPKNASYGPGLVVKLFNKRGEPCKGKKC